MERAQLKELLAKQTKQRQKKRLEQERVFRPDGTPAPSGWTDADQPPMQTPDQPQQYQNYRESPP